MSDPDSDPTKDFVALNKRLAEDPGEPVSDSQRAYITLLFNKYRAPLNRYIRRFVSADDAGDLTQETYFRLLRHGRMVQLEAMARSFLFQTATNLVRDHRRRRITHFADLHIPLTDDEAGTTVAEPADDIIGEQALGALEVALEKMPEDVRRVFLLCRFRDLEYAQIGKLMALSTRSVARKMAQAIELLSAALGEVR